MQDFRKLDVWSRSMGLVQAVYRLTSSFPRSEMFGLVSQMRGSALSVPSNIAEGCGRSAPKDFVRFLRIAVGSACELETQLLVAVDVGYLDASVGAGLVDECEQIRRMLTGLQKRVAD